MAKNFMIVLVVLLVAGVLIWIVSYSGSRTAPPESPPGDSTRLPEPPSPPEPEPEEEPLAPERIYTVRKGDTLTKIARDHYGPGRTDLARIIGAENNIGKLDQIWPGDRLRIPDLSDPKREAELLAKYERIKNGELLLLYRARAGESLAAIVRSVYGPVRNATEAERAVARLSGDAPAAGQWVRLPNSDQFQPRRPFPARSFLAWLYRVRRSDTLSSLARRDLAAIALIRSINQLGPKDTVVEDQPLLIPVESSAAEAALASP